MCLCHCLQVRNYIKRAEKHAKSARNQPPVAAAKAKGKGDGPNIRERVIIAASEAATESSSCIKLLLKTAYFMFSSEIADTSLWQETVSAASTCDSSNRLANFIRTCSANAHHLSTTTITSILEAFGVAIVNNIRARLSSCTEYAVMADESTNVNNEEMLSIMCENS